MANAEGETPLRRACRYGNSTVEVFRHMIEENPEALTEQDRNGTTPLHRALSHHRNSPEILHCLLDRCPPEVLGMRTSEGYTPLHLACFWGVSVEIIRRIVRMYPKALRMFDTYGWSPLYLACFSSRPSLEVIRYLVNQLPALCLLLDINNKSPYDQAAEHQRLAPPPEILSFLAEATKEAAIAFLVCSSQGMITLSPAVTAHIQRVLLPDFATQGFSMSYMSSNEHIRLLLEETDTIKRLVTNNTLQEMLKDEDKQDLIRIIIPLVKASNRINIDETLPETKHHVSIFEAVSETPDCIYLHLRNNPSLCCRSMTGHTTYRPAATSQEEVPTTSTVQSVSTSEETSNEVHVSGRQRKAGE
jgi:ankyrin repeat protein